MTKPKFPMHHIHFYQSLKTVGIAVLISCTATCSFYVLHNLPRRQKYANFYSNYDPMVSFKRMMEGGYLDSCLPTKGKNNKNA